MNKRKFSQLIEKLNNQKNKEKIIKYLFDANLIYKNIVELIRQNKAESIRVVCILLFIISYTYFTKKLLFTQLTLVGLSSFLGFEGRLLKPVTAIDVEKIIMTICDKAEKIAFNANFDLIIVLTSVCFILMIADFLRKYKVKYVEV